MTVTAAYTSSLTVRETLDSSAAPAAVTNNRVVTHDQFNKAASLTGSTTPPVTKVAALEQALSAGAATVDLTALNGTGNLTIDGTGLRVQAIKFVNKSTNANNMTLTDGAANAYDGFGTGFSVTLPPGGEILIYTNDGGTDISGTNKNLDLSGTGTQTAQLEIVLG